MIKLYYTYEMQLILYKANLNIAILVNKITLHQKVKYFITLWNTHTHTQKKKKLFSESRKKKWKCHLLPHICESPLVNIFQTGKLYYKNLLHDQDNFLTIRLNTWEYKLVVSEARWHAVRLCIGEVAPQSWVYSQRLASELMRRK